MPLQRLVNLKTFKQQCCMFLNLSQKHATCCLFSGYAENRSQWHVTLHMLHYTCYITHVTLRRFLRQHRIVANRRRKSFSVTLAKNTANDQMKTRRPLSSAEPFLGVLPICYLRLLNHSLNSLHKPLQRRVRQYSK